MINRVVRLLADALEEAIKECREHNSEYHHTTPEYKLKLWENLIEKVRETL